MVDAERVRRWTHLGGYEPRGVLVAAIVAIAAIGGLALALVLPSALKDRASSDAGGGRQARDLPLPPQGQPVISASIQVDPGVTDIVTGYGAVWASTPNAVFKIDPLSKTRS